MAHGSSSLDSIDFAVKLEKFEQKFYKSVCPEDPSESDWNTRNKRGRIVKRPVCIANNKALRESRFLLELGEEHFERLTNIHLMLVN